MSLFGTRRRRVGAMVLTAGMWTAAAVVITGSPREPELFALLLVVGLVVLLAALVSTDSVGRVPPGLYRHVLKDDLQMREFSELGGVQYVSLPFPDRGPVGDPMVLLFLLQNAYTEPRVFRLGRGRGVLQTTDPPAEIDLAGGECGALVVRMSAKPGTKPGEYSIRFRPRVRKVGRAGTRIFPTPKASMTISAPQFQAIHTVTDGVSRGATPDLPPSGYRVVFRAGMETPDTAPLEFLNAKVG